MNKITYEFNLESGGQYRFEIDISGNRRLPDTGEIKNDPWTALDFQKCPNCALDSNICKLCPVAFDIEQAVEKFRGIQSFKRANVSVHTDQRSYFKNCDIMTGLMSMFGLIMASSKCPVLSRLGLLVDYHLPFATLDETVIRVVGVYLLKQYYIQVETKHKTDLEMEDLYKLYQEIEIVNRQLMKRLKTASRMDANTNAIGIFNTLSSAITFNLDTLLADIKPNIINGL